MNSEAVQEKILIVLEKMLEGFLAFLPNILSAVVIFILSYFLARILSKYIYKLIIKAIKDETLAVFLKKVIFVAILLLGCITALTNLGVKTASIIAVLGTAGLAIALSLKDSLSNLASGILLVVFRKFNKGDMVNIASITGVVDSIDLLYTRITTPDNQLVIIPNSTITASPIINMNINKVRRVDMTFGIAYSSDLEKSKALLESLCAKNTMVLKNPPPLVGVSTLGASSVDFLVRFWVKCENVWQVQYDLTQEVKLTFDKEDIEIPYNKLDININPKLLLSGDKQ